MAKKNKIKLNNESEKYEKGITKSKLMIFFDWVWRLFILNTLTIVTSLGVVTLLPSIVACFRTIKECYENDEQHLVKRFYGNFVFCFVDTVGIGIFFLVIFCALGYSFFYYSSMIDELNATGSGENWITIFWLLLFLSILVFLMFFLVYMQLPMVVTYLHLHFFDKIKLAFFMAFKYFGGTLEEFLLVFMWALLCFVIWPYVPIVFAFIVTVPLVLNYMVSRKYYWSFANQIEYEYDENKYDIEGTTQNRETYEDKEER